VAVRTFDESGVRGFLHEPGESGRDGLVLAHGAGSDCNSTVLVAVAEAFAADGMAVLRIDLPFRRERLKGAPGPGWAARDRAGLAQAAAALRGLIPGRVFLGGHSYGGRQASMLCAEEPSTAAALLLLSYPLHPPRSPSQQRTAHFPNLHRPALFVHGTRDPFGSPEEMREATALIPGRLELVFVEAAGHDLGRRARELAPHWCAAFRLVILEQRGS
jgi:uncharacterized protein